MTMDFQSRSLLSLDLPGFAYIGNGVQMFADGDMALAGTAFYSAGNGATLSKQSGAPGYYQCLRVAVNVLANPYCANTGMAQIVGQVYRLTGVGRGDGVNGRPLILDSGATFLFQGTTSTSWQPFDVTFTAAGAGCYFFNYAASGYAEFTNLRIELAPASTRNLGTLGGYAQLGDGYAAATFPTQVFPHGMSFDGASDYLLRAETTNELTFTDPAQFSVEALCIRNKLGVGVYSTLFCKNGGGGGGAFSAPYDLYVVDDGVSTKVVWGSFNSAGGVRGIVAVTVDNHWPAYITTHVVGVYDGTTWRLYFNGVQGITGVTLGCYAPDVASFPLYTGLTKLGGTGLQSYFSGKIFNAAVYPFALQPGEISQLYRQRLGLLNRGF